MPFSHAQIQHQSGRLALTADDGTVIGTFDDSGNIRLKVEALLKSGHGLATETTLAAVLAAIGSMSGGGGGGVQYTEGATDPSITGTAVMWEDAADTLRAVSAAKPLPVVQTGTPVLPTGAATEATLADLNVNAGDIETILSSIKDTAGIKKITDALPTGANTIGKVDQGTGGASAWKVDGSAFIQPVSGPLTDAQLRASPVPVTGTLSATVVLPNEGQQTMANSISVAIASDQSTVPVSAASLPLPTGAATSANQSTEITALQLIDDVVHAPNAAISKVAAIGGQMDDAATVVATEGNVSAARITAQRAIHTNLRNDGGTEVGTSGAPLRTDPTGTTAQPVTDGGGSLTVDGPLTDAQLRASAVPVSAASLPLPTGAATLAEQQTQTTALQLIDDVVHAVNGAVSKSALMGGQLDDAATTAATENNVAPVRITAQRAMHANLRDNAGAELGTSGNPVRTDTTGTTTQPVSAASLPLPTGAATSANQSTEITALQLIDDIVHATNAAVNKAALMAGQLDDAATTDATENNAAPVRITTKRALHVNLRNDGGTEVGTAGAPVRTDPTGTTTQPISAASLPLPTGAATEATLALIDTTLNNVEAAYQTQGATTSVGRNVLIGAAVTTAAPSYAATQTHPLSLDLSGGLRVSGSNVEDAASANGDAGVVFLARRTASPANTSGTDGDYEVPQMANGRLWVSAFLDTQLPSGTNNIGDVDILSIIPGTGATNLGKAAASTVYAANDVGTSALAVRNDAGGALSGVANGEYTALQTDSAGSLRVTSVAPSATTGTPASVTVSTTAVQLKAANSSRIAIVVTNNGSNNVFIGTTSGVTASGAAMGHILVPGGYFREEVWRGAVYGITAAVNATQNVCVWEMTA